MQDQLLALRALADPLLDVTAGDVLALTASALLLVLIWCWEPEDGPLRATALVRLTAAPATPAATTTSFWS